VDDHFANTIGCSSEARTQQQLVEHRLANIHNNKARKGFTWGFSDKTGWDWLDLTAKLAIPLVVLIATLGFGWWQAHPADLPHRLNSP